MRSDFCAFILTHGRPDNVKTFKTLEKCGYTGDVVIVIDNEDDRAAEYYERFGEMVYMFDKLAVSRTFDAADQSQDRRTIVYARNACFDIARELGYRYFIELDDDYTDFMFRFEYDGKLGYKSAWDLDSIIDAFIEFLDSSKALSVAFAQGGDLIGGLGNCNFIKGILRKAMNSFICDVERPFKFVGRINEDVNTYVLYGSRGGAILYILEVPTKPDADSEEQRRNDRRLRRVRYLRKVVLYGNDAPIVGICCRNWRQASKIAP